VVIIVNRINSKTQIYYVIKIYCLDCKYVVLLADLPYYPVVSIVVYR